MRLDLDDEDLDNIKSQYLINGKRHILDKILSEMYDDSSTVNSEPNDYFKFEFKAKEKLKSAMSDDDFSAMEKLFTLLEFSEHCITKDLLPKLIVKYQDRFYLNAR